MRLDVVTIFPEYLQPLRHALLGKAIEQGLLTVGVHDLRDWTADVHRSVDDVPFGGGPGMVMKPQVWGSALDDVAAGTGPAAQSAPLHSAHAHALRDHGTEAEAYPAPADDRTLPLLLVPTPAGAPFTQDDARAWSSEEHIVFACGRYEGIDQRVIDDAASRYRVREVSIGDFVLIGGEVAVLAIAEAVVRLIPGVLGNQASHQEDSFSDGLLEGPSYTKPREWRGRTVPEVLTSGDHKRIARWRREQALLRTQQRRPDLLGKLDLDEADNFVLHARAVHSDLSVLLSAAEWDKVASKLPRRLKKNGYVVESVDAHLEEPSGQAPAEGPTHKILINGFSTLEATRLTDVVLRALPAGTTWHGSSGEGHRDPHSSPGPQS